LNEHPAVAEAAVIGRADPRWQEVPVAYVVRRQGASVEAETLIRHVGRQLARFKIPREVVFIDDLPRNALGKVQHFRLKEQTQPTA
jgi:fatty-acyl-CoA synthase